MGAQTEALQEAWMFDTSVPPGMEGLMPRFFSDLQELFFLNPAESQESREGPPSTRRGAGLWEVPLRHPAVGLSAALPILGFLALFYF